MYFPRTGCESPAIPESAHNIVCSASELLNVAQERWPRMSQGFGPSPAGRVTGRRISSALLLGHFTSEDCLNPKPGSEKNRKWRQIRLTAYLRLRQTVTTKCFVDR